MQFKNLFISFVMSGSSKGSVFEQWELESKSRPRFGRNWWFWLPSYNWNGGKFKNYENTDISILWLCFSVSITVYSWNRR